MIRANAAAVFFACLATQLTAYDLGLSDRLVDTTTDIASDSIEQTPTVSEGLMLDVVDTALGSVDSPLVFEVNGVIFVPLGPDAASRLWQVSFDAPPRTRVALDFTAFDRDASGVVQGFTSIDNVEISRLSEPFEVAIPSAATHVEIATSGPIQIAFAPVPQVAVQEVPLVGQTTTIVLADVLDVALDYALPAGPELQNLVAEIRLPVNISGNVQAKLGNHTVTYALTGQPAVVPPFAFGQPIDELRFDLTRGAGFGDDPWPFAPVSLTLVDVQSDEIEPNPSIEKATPVVWNDDDRRTRLTGRLSNDDDVDVWRLDYTQARSERALEIDVSTDDASLTAILRNAEGQTLTAQRGTGGISLESLVLSEGLYFFEITKGSDATTDYDLQFKSVRRPRDAKEIEPNDAVQMAQGLPLGQAIAGRTAAMDVDRYAFQITEAGKMWGVVTPGEVSVTLTDSEGTTISEGLYEAASKITRVPPVPLPVGNYLIEVSGQDSYVVEVRDFGPRPDDWEIEPNGAEHRANYVALGGQVRGQLALGDYDIVYFDVPVKQDIVVQVDAPDDAAIQIDMAFSSGSSFVYTRLSAGESFDQVWELEAGEYSLSLKLYPSVPTLDTWRVAVSPFVGQPPIDLEPNGDIARLVPPFTRIIGQDGHMDQNDLFEIRLPAAPGHVLYPCQFRPGGEDRYAIAPNGVRFGDLDRQRMPHNGFAHAGDEGQSFYPYMDEWGTHGYNCAAHWFTPETLQAAVNDQPVQEFSWATGIRAGGVRSLTVPAVINIAVPEDADGYSQTFAVDFGGADQAVHVQCKYDDGLISAALFDDGGQRLGGGRMSIDSSSAIQATTQTGFVAFRQEINVTTPYTCALGFTQDETSALFTDDTNPIAFDLAGIPSRNNQTIDGFGIFAHTLLPGDLRLVPNYVSEARDKNGLIGAQCHYNTTDGAETLLPHAIFASAGRWSYTPDLPEAAISYQCTFFDADNLPMLPLAQEGATLADVAIAVAAHDVPAFAPHLNAAQSAGMTATLRNEGVLPVSVDLHADVAAPRWHISAPDGAVTLAPGVDVPVTLTVTAPSFLLEQDMPALQLVARTTGGVVLDETFAIAIAADAPAQNPIADWRVPPSIAGGINLAALRFGGEVVKVGDKVADGETYVIDGEAPTQGDGVPRFADRQPSFTVDLAGVGRQPVAGFFYTLRRQSLPYNAPMRQMLVEWSADDGASYQTVATYDLSLGADRQYFVLPEVLQATHIRVTNPDCRTRFCVAFTEFGVVGQPGHVPDTLAEALNIADPIFGGNLVTVSGLIGPYSQDVLLTDETLDVTVEEPLGDAQVKPLELLVGFHNARLAQVGRIVWTGAQTQEPPVTFDAFAVRDALSAPVPLGQITTPQPGEDTAIALPEGTQMRFLKLVADVPAGKHRIAGQLSVIETPTQVDGYRSVLGIWDEDDPRGYTDWTAPQEVPAIPVQVTTSQSNPLLLAAQEVIQSHTYKEIEPDFFQMPASRESVGAVWRIVTLNAPRHVEVGPSLTDTQGDEVPLMWIGDVLKDRPDLADFLQSALPEKQDGWADQTHYLVQVDPSETYQLRIAEEGRLMVIRRERTGMLFRSDTVRKRSYDMLAAILGDGRDGLDVGVAGLDGDTILRGEDQILLGMSRLPGPDDDEAVVTTDFGEAVLASSEQFKRWPGGKTLVYFGMGGGIMQVEDMDWIFALQDTPVRTRAILAPCDAGNFFCPDARETDTNAMSFAASTNGQFTRTTTRSDLRRAFLQAAYGMQGPKPYSVSWRDVTLPPEPATLTVVLASVAEGLAQEDEALTAASSAPDVAGPPALSLILDASGSMLKRLGGERRINIAKAALSDLIETSVPDDTLVSFRAFGLAEDACETRNLAPLAPLDRAGLLPVITGVPAINLAKTPIAASLEAAVREDLAEATGPKALILVTDGEETCDGNVEAVLEELQSAGIQMNLSIVGFAIDDPALKAEFARWSVLGNGQYYDTSNASDLRDALQEALTAAVPDPVPTTVTINAIVNPDFVPLTVPLKNAATLPAGEYLLTLDTGATRTITLAAGSEQEIGVDGFAAPTTTQDP